jgi:hypothetical protein
MNGYVIEGLGAQSVQIFGTHRGGSMREFGGILTQGHILRGEWSGAPVVYQSVHESVGLVAFLCGFSDLNTEIVRVGLRSVITTVFR